MNKPKPTRSLSELATGYLADTFKRQGFASTELVTRWREIVGPEIAEHAEPLKLQWRRTAEGEPTEPATLVLRVEGPAAIEIQHQSKLAAVTSFEELEKVKNELAREKERLNSEMEEKVEEVRSAT